MNKKTPLAENEFVHFQKTDCHPNNKLPFAARQHK
jgi:hypothetical protein